MLHRLSAELSLRPWAPQTQLEPIFSPKQVRLQPSPTQCRPWGPARTQAILLGLSSSPFIARLHQAEGRVGSKTWRGHGLAHAGRPRQSNGAEGRVGRRGDRELGGAVHTGPCLSHSEVWSCLWGWAFRDHESRSDLAFPRVSAALERRVNKRF